MLGQQIRRLPPKFRHDARQAAERGGRGMRQVDLGNLNGQRQQEPMQESPRLDQFGDRRRRLECINGAPRPDGDCDEGLPHGGMHLGPVVIVVTEVLMKLE